MLNAIKFLVGSSQHVFPEISIKLYYCQERRNFRFISGKNNLRHQKGNKKLHVTHYYYTLLLFFTFSLSYERYFPTSAQEISAILGHFPILKQQ